MNTREEIIDFIDNKELTGAMLISGKWGCGKTYLIKELVKKLNAEKKYAIAIISLFGVESVSALVQIAKSEYLNLRSTFLGKAARKVSKGFISAVQAGMEVSVTAIPSLTSLAAISKGIGKAASVNIFDVLKIHNTIGTKKNKRDFVLIFDDFERSKIDTADLLGVINEFCENRKIKTIIVANEEQIKSKKEIKDNFSESKTNNEQQGNDNGDKYKELREKVISRTLKIKLNYNEIVNSIIGSYQEAEVGYKDFLNHNLKSIIYIFTNSQHDNIRSLKCALANYERIYKIWQDNNFQTDFINQLLFSFLILTIEFKANNFGLDEDKCFNFYNKETLAKYTNGTFRLIRLDSLENWIVYGDWNEKKFIKIYSRIRLLPQFLISKSFYIIQYMS